MKFGDKFPAPKVREDGRGSEEKKWGCYCLPLLYYPAFDETIPPQEVARGRGGKQVRVVAVNTVGHGDRISREQVHFNCCGDGRVP